MNKYDPKSIEEKWQAYWDKEKTFEVKEEKKKKKFYGLIEFPYPSGAGLHVGHPRSYTAMDVIARKRRMEGYNVLYPIGFDSFGLPTENFAIKTGRPPADITTENIATFTRQLKALGFSFDWSRAVTTSDPEYYKWTQWIFLQFFKHGLAYKKKQPINWCPKDKIGLANEEVVDGCCERCGGPVEKRDKEQWMLAITKYADKLLNGLNEVDYIERAKLQQQNWIGKSEGAEVVFRLRKIPGQEDDKHTLTIFTTRPDTMFGATFVAISPELAKKWLDIGWQASSEVKAYIEKTLAERIKAGREEQEKTGIDAGFVAVNPANGEEIPVWVANYVMGDVGTGAIMAVPAHDERDWEFAKKYHLPIKEVVAKQLGERLENSTSRRSVRGICVRDGKLAVIYDYAMDEYLLPGGGIEEGEDPETALKREVQEELGYTDSKVVACLGTVEHNYYHQFKKNNWQSISTGFVLEVDDANVGERSQDDQKKAEVQWLPIDEAFEKLKNSKTFSRKVEFVERFKNKKGELFTEDGVAIHSEFLNSLPTKEAKEKMIGWLEEKGIGQRKTQYKLRDWVFSRQRYWGEPIPLVHCEKCEGWIPLPEKELPLTLPDVKNYQPTDTGESPLASMTEWVNTTCPNCGGPARRETDTMPNWAGSSWYFLRYCDPNNTKEFASMDKLKYWMPVDWYNGGMEHTVLHLLYSRFWNQFLHDIGVVPSSEPYKKRTSHGMILASDGQKMSKSLGNVVNPDEMVERFGADALRTYIMFMGPFDQAIAWDTNGLVGVSRFLDRVWFLQAKLGKEKNSAGIDMVLHQTIKKVTEDIEEMHFNTAVAKLMELTNELNKEETVSEGTYGILIRLLSPFAPHLCEELWQILGNKKSIAYTEWPSFDESKLVSDTMTIAVQVNGKLRDTIVIPAGSAEHDVQNMALASEKVQKWLEGKELKKVIYVKGKLVSIVV
ncbi:MAG TPA: class I tRNA ligase family protein [Candidatus Kapabacteria bacterium]|nr:class I tRNA ligase family protein [Candidatus Kapabacteria bacterium]